MAKETLKWYEWKPGLAEDQRTLGEVIATMPASDAAEVPEIIRRYENPASPTALPGAINLARHDCIHVLLGRGLTVQDEAFVIGVTMGAAKEMSNAAARTFELVSTDCYPHPWRLSPHDILAFRLGLGYAQAKLPDLDLHLIPLEHDSYQDRRVTDIRGELNIRTDDLRSYNVLERLLLPESRPSTRLGCFAGLPDRALDVPRGPDRTREYALAA